MFLKNLEIIVYNDLCIGERPVGESGTTALFFSGEKDDSVMNVTQISTVGVISKTGNLMFTSYQDSDLKSVQAIFGAESSRP